MEHEKMEMNPAIGGANLSPRRVKLVMAAITFCMFVMGFSMFKLLPMQAPMTSQPLLELIFAVSLPAVGSAILFNLDASSGGTDIVAMVLKKFTSLNIGRALMCSDCIITVMACVAFGMETGLFSILGLLMKSLLVDMVLENINTHKCFHIITAHPETIQDFIVKNLHRGATALQGEGVFTHEGRTVLLTVVNRHEAILLRKYIKAVDPTCFLLITNTFEFTISLITLQISLNTTLLELLLCKSFPIFLVLSNNCTLLIANLQVFQITRLSILQLLLLGILAYDY